MGKIRRYATSRFKGCLFKPTMEEIILTGTVVHWHATAVLLSMTVVKSVAFCNDRAMVISGFKP